MVPSLAISVAMKRVRPGLAALLAAFVMIAASVPARAQDAAEIILRLDRLEAENRRLNGQIEELKFVNRRLEDQLKRFQSDTDLRMRDLEGGRAGAPRTQAPQTPQGGISTNRRQDAFDPAQNPNAAGAPRQINPGGSQPLAGGALTAGTLAPGNIAPGAVPPGGRSVGGSLNAPLDVTVPRQPGISGGVAAAPNFGADPRMDFDYARALLQRGDNEQAEGAFREFIRIHARDRRVPEATFWLGESFFNRTRYREAAEYYLNVTTRYSTAARAPEAMLKLGMSLRGLGAVQEACGTFNQVPRKYPNASPSVLAAVNREKARASC